MEAQSSRSPIPCPKDEDSPCRLDRFLGIGWTGHKNSRFTCGCITFSGILHYPDQVEGQARDGTFLSRRAPAPLCRKQCSTLIQDTAVGRGSNRLCRRYPHNLCAQTRDGHDINTFGRLSTEFCPTNQHRQKFWRPILSFRIREDFVAQPNKTVDSFRHLVIR